MVVGFVAVDAHASAGALATYSPPGQLVTLATGHQLHVLCAGHGRPDLVLLAGFGGDVLDWTPVLPALAKFQQVCAVDRLGQGWSDRPNDDNSRTLTTAVDEVHEAVLALGMQRPIVVGHSLGGALAQIYAARHPVAGLILVDGLTLGVADPVLARLGTYEAFAPVARLGFLRPLGGALVDPAYTGALRTEMVALRSRSEVLLAIAREGAVARQSGGSELAGAETALQQHPLPLLVIAAGASDVPDLPPGAFAAAERAFAETVPGAQFTLVPEARHYLMAEQPQTVADLMQAWLTTRQD